MKTIGILGGMGPQATAEIFQKIVEISTQKYGASEFGAFPHVLLSNLPIPHSQDPLPGIQMLIQEGRKLTEAGADFFVIPCNTLHGHIDIIQDGIGMPIFSILEEVAEQVHGMGLKTVGVLSSRTTLRMKLYQDILKKYDILSVDPNTEQQEFTAEAIRKVVAGNFNKSDIDRVLNIIEDLKKNGAEGIILGCTELPLLLHGYTIGIPSFDSLHILAEAACREAYK